MPVRSQSVAHRARVWTETHEPRGGGMQKFLGPLYPTGVFWFRASYLFARWTPFILADLYALWATCWCCLLMRRLRRRITSNLDVVMGKASGFLQRERRIFRTFRMFSQITIDRYAMFHHRDRLKATFTGVDNWKAALGGERGCVMVSAHFGNWEVASLLPATIEKRTHVVREREIDARSQELIESLYEHHKSDRFVVHFADDSVSLGPKLLFALRRGEVVGLSGDQPRTGQTYVEVEMFGRPTPIPHGPAALARAAEVAILPVFGVRTGPFEYEVIVCEPIAVARTDDRHRDVFEATQKLASHMEAVIRAHPHSWFCWWPRWPETTDSLPAA